MCCICRDHIDLGKTSKELGARGNERRGYKRARVPEEKAVEVTKSDSGG
jgi:hypothetical protein